jgi:hypothetical protein
MGFDTSALTSARLRWTFSSLLIRWLQACHADALTCRIRIELEPLLRAALGLLTPAMTSGQKRAPQPRHPAPPPQPDGCDIRPYDAALAAHTAREDFIGAKDVMDDEKLVYLDSRHETLPSFASHASSGLPLVTRDEIAGVP